MEKRRVPRRQEENQEIEGIITQVQNREVGIASSLRIYIYRLLFTATKPPFKGLLKKSSLTTKYTKKAQSTQRYKPICQHFVIFVKKPPLQSGHNAKIAHRAIS
jgi:hypothetical protein